jgi:hypothetical protein
MEMKKLIICMLILLFTTSADAATIIDHRHTNLDVDLQKVDIVKDSVKWLFIRLSHGRQVNVGLDRIEDDDFSVCITYDYLCTEENALCSSNGNTEPYGFWSNGGANIIRARLDSEPVLNLVMFNWCTHLDTYTAGDVGLYLSEMDKLEEDYPNVTFVYATGTAEAQGGYGLNRYERNLQIRNYCEAQDKILYDFADIECWYAGELATYLYDGVQVPYLHPELFGDDAEHTSFLNCEYKGMAFWNLVTRDERLTGEENIPTATRLGEIYPNPFNPGTTVLFELGEPSRVTLRIYDVSGRLVRELVNENREMGTYSERWDGRDSSGRSVASGVYFCQFKCGGSEQTKKMVLLE